MSNIDAEYENKNAKTECNNPIKSSNLLSNHQKEAANIDIQLTYALDILDKQYRLYSWNDSKTNSVITANSLLIAVVGFLYKDALSDLAALILLSLSLICLGISLFYSLKQVIPQGSSGKSGKTPNIRSLSGIASYKNVDEYHGAYVLKTHQELTYDVIRQIYGMTANNDISRKTTKKGIYLTISGMILVIISTFMSSLAANNKHILGAWAPDKVQVIEIKRDDIKSVDTTLTIKTEQAPAANSP